MRVQVNCLVCRLKQREWYGLLQDDVADFVALDLNDVRMAGAQPLTAAVWGAARVTDVWVGGRQIVQGGAHPGTRAIVDRANAVLNELR